jgi:hypothetical protein
MAALGSDREGERAGYFDSDSEDSDGEYLSMAQKRVGGQSRPATSHGMSPDNSAHSPSHGNDIPQEVRAEVDRIFFEYLNRICSDRRFRFNCLFFGAELIVRVRQSRLRMQKANLYTRR